MKLLQYSLPLLFLWWSARTSEGTEDAGRNSNNNKMEESIISACNIPRSYQDPNLQLMKFNLGYGPEETLVYVPPHVSTMYRSSDTEEPQVRRTPVHPKFEGYAAVFLNLSKEHIRLYFEEQIDSLTPRLEIVLSPFSSKVATTYPDLSYYFTPGELPSEHASPYQHKLMSFRTTKPSHSVHAFDPYYVKGDAPGTTRNLESAGLTQRETILYRLLRRSVDFSALYSEWTGRGYLVHYPRPRSPHFFWPAEYFGQEHWITTRETHFARMPPSDKLHKLEGGRNLLSDDEDRLLSEYRDTSSTDLNMTLKVLSVAPRVLEIPNFLSQIEVDHILQIAGREQLDRSYTGMKKRENETIESRASEIRTSTNSWIERERSPIIESIYRRASDLLRMDEALFRNREAHENDFPGVGKVLKTLAEPLQLVHYDPGQGYAVHYDFGFPTRMEDSRQAQRFATLLLYLNDGMVGGRTSFPRWVNSETFDPLSCKPVAGKAVLFYNQLPDGNLDDLSIHEATKVWEHEKWLINLWVWSPVMY